MRPDLYISIPEEQANKNNVPTRCWAAYRLFFHCVAFIKYNTQFHPVDRKRKTQRVEHEIFTVLLMMDEEDMTFPALSHKLYLYCVCIYVRVCPESY